ncbi:HTH domain-containing protein [Lacticaseibacillus saniviri]|uniref:HTH domain-containing protein n=1 Tax=Lacticaseibacillus saniviri TaxID=931533 RepID=UPI0006D081D8|nr:HTH domain-containing protein [Lacticaseibacillus saniviri]
MYNQREIKILNLLLVNDYSGEELAQQLNTSRRTVIRDIASINTELAQENIGEITAFNGYHLKLLDSAALRQILDRSEDEKNQILLALCLTQTITQADLSAQLFLSKAAVQDYVEQLNIELHGVITIKSHVGAGLGISFTRLSAVDIVAALFLEYPRLQKMLPIELIQQEHIEQLGNSLLNPYAQWLTRMQWHNQLLACLVALPIDEASSQMQFPIPSLSGISKVQQQHLSLFLSHRMMQMQAVLSQKQSLLESFTRLSHQFQLSGVGLNTFEDIFSHIVREVAFPRPIAGLNQSEMYRLQAQNPIAFDLAHTFTEVLLDQFPECWWDDRYIGLYIVQAINQRAVQPVRVLLLAPRASLQKLIKRSCNSN